MKITEEDIVRAYIPFIFQKCKDKYKGLELEDRLSEGYIVLLYAIRTYKISYGCFEDYLDSQFERIMKQKNAKVWAERKLESLLSLDAPIKMVLVYNCGHEKVESDKLKS